MKRATVFLSHLQPSSTSSSSFSIGIDSCSGEEHVEVYVEPCHQVELENQYVRVLRWQSAPGQATKYHKHTVDSLKVFFNKARIKASVPGKDPGFHDHVPGGCASGGYTSQPEIHEIANVGKTWTHGLDVEVICPKLSSPGLPISGPNHTLAHEFPRARMYRFHLKPQESTKKEIVHTGPRFITFIYNSSIEVRMNGTTYKKKVNKGSYDWQTTRWAAIVTNVGDGPFEAIISQIL